MSNWFFVALLGPILWSIVNHIDKYMLSKYLKERGVGALIIFSALASALVLPFVGYVYRSEIFAISIIDLVILIIVGLLSVGAFYLYLEGMREEEASIVVPLYQLTPVFGYFFGFIILGETLSGAQIFASLIIILGILALTVEIDVDNHITLKIPVLILISGSSLLFALHDTLFKKVTVVESFWVSVFWQYVSLTLAGIGILFFIPRFRRDFFSMFRNTGAGILTLNITSELLYIAGNLANNFAILFAPVALVLVVSSYQPVFVFIGGILLTIFLPHISIERITGKHLFQKIASITIILIGSYLLYSLPT